MYAIQVEYMTYLTIIIDTFILRVNQKHPKYVNTKYTINYLRLYEMTYYNEYVIIYIYILYFRKYVPNNIIIYSFIFSSNIIYCF